MSEKRRTIRDISKQKGQTPVVCLTSYTAPLTRLVDSQADLILVGDSLGMVVYGMDSTVPVTMDMMIAHGRAVVNASAKALVVVDMPFGSYQESPQQAYRNAVRILKETGCQAVKLEGGQEMAETISFMTERGIAVMGHIGLQPQSVNSVGGYHVIGRSTVEEQKLYKDADAVTQAGAFCVVIECTAESVATEITARIAIPTIGIGASAACDGQILVTEDMLGFSSNYIPKFVHPYGNLAEQAKTAVQNYANDVRSRAFPRSENVYTIKKKANE